MNLEYWTNFTVTLLQITFRLSTLYIIAAMGEVVLQRSGIFNVSIEGLMTIGAIVAYVTAIATGGYFTSLLVAAFVGIFLGAFLGLLIISLKMDQTLTGMLMWIFGIGAGALLYRIVFGEGLSNSNYKNGIN
ncbi:MAG: hypothetical protein QW589_03025 [Candidatus Bathyarchaeia archaeon]